MVFAINAATEGEKTFTAYKQLAIAQNGTGLANSPIQSNVAYPAQGTVTINPGEAPCATATAYPVDKPNDKPSVVSGEGVVKDDNCSCHCLCGSNAFPNGLGAHGYGGWGGMLPKQ
jgi:hypothetical protein